YVHTSVLQSRDLLFQERFEVRGSNRRIGSSKVRAIRNARMRTGMNTKPLRQQKAISHALLVPRVSAARNIRRRNRAHERLRLLQRLPFTQIAVQVNSHYSPPAPLVQFL